MQLTYFTDLSLRVLRYLAQKPAGYPRVPMREIAHFYRVSHEHLRKVVHRLAAEGYLATTQGRHGGLRLGRPSSRINVGDVVEAMERDFFVLLLAWKPLWGRLDVGRADRDEPLAGSG